jgi:hypothetical protein
MPREQLDRLVAFVGDPDRVLESPLVVKRLRLSQLCWDSTSRPALFVMASEVAGSACSGFDSGMFTISLIPVFRPQDPMARDLDAGIVQSSAARSSERSGLRRRLGVSMEEDP